MKKLALVLLDAAIAMMGAAFTTFGITMGVSDVSSMRAERRAMNAIPGPEAAPAVEEAPNAEESAE